MSIAILLQKERASCHLLLPILFEATPEWPRFVMVSLPVKPSHKARLRKNNQKHHKIVNTKLLQCKWMLESSKKLQKHQNCMKPNRINTADTHRNTAEHQLNTAEGQPNTAETLLNTAETQRHTADT